MLQNARVGALRRMRFGDEPCVHPSARPGAPFSSRRSLRAVGQRRAVLRGGLLGAKDAGRTSDTLESVMSQTGAERLVDGLIAWGVTSEVNNITRATGIIGHVGKPLRSLGFGYLRL